MKRMAWLSVVLPSVLSCAAFAGDGPAADHAAAKEREICGGQAPLDEDARIVSPRTVSSVEPLQVWSNPKVAGPVLVGAQVRLVALPGLTPEWIARTLECHAARLELRRAPAADDPYWLPGRRVTIAVQSEGDRFVVSLRGESLADAQEILKRARSFAQR